MAMWWWSDVGTILADDSTVKWGYTWNIPPSRWLLRSGMFPQITTTAGERADIGAFSIFKTGGTYSRDTIRVVSTTPAEFSRSGSAGGPAVGDVCSLDAESGLLTDIFASSSSLSTVPPDGLDSITFGIIQTRTDWQDDDFNSRKQLTVKKEFVHGTPRNIPVKVDFAADDLALLYAMTHYHTGAMLRVFTSDDVEIPCEAGVRYVQGEPDQIRLFFLAPELSSNEDTVFYLYYGSTLEAPLTFKDADVWLPNGNSGVWHDGYEIVGDYAKSLGRY